MGSIVTVSCSIQIKTGLHNPSDLHPYLGNVEILHINSIFLVMF